MTPAEMAALHASAFDGAARWSEAAFAATLSAPETFVVTSPAGFAIGRVTLDEAELLTLVVAPEHRRRGEGRALVSAFAATARDRGAGTGFLEVAADNAAARALYARTGWREGGRRRGYYGGTDALILVTSF
ncbi:GNAT family N-acetyltransferase [uncultured Jannaschia sp.]|uniref:GNAT family N-acetyltransferase n=1 Tax=uncultured Jannaschia sp. TaxID=293347 RepID=UPI0026082BB2|nr:GNAT family N-acetyltransferase [uncultured Jannaschia sp.]